MASEKTNYDKTLLAVTALIALGVAGYIFMLKGSFSEKLASSKITPRAEFADIPMANVENAMKNLQNVYDWRAPEKHGKPVPLNKSIPVVVHDGKLIDMFVEEPQLRPPMTNKYLRENELDYLAPNVGELDPDGDGFSNLEEFNKQTSPRDAKSHPPLTDKLYFKERVQNDYLLVLQSPEPPLLVRRLKPEPATSAFVQPPFPLDFSLERDRALAPRFTATAFEPKKAPDGRSLSELSVTDKATGSKFVLVYKVPYNLAEYQATMEFRIGTVQTFTVKKGDKFRINGIAATYRLLDVTEESATVAELKSDDTNGAPFVVNKRP